jgi:hypothetical protein
VTGSQRILLGKSYLAHASYWSYGTATSAKHISSSDRYSAVTKYNDFIEYHAISTAEFICYLSIWMNEQNTWTVTPVSNVTGFLFGTWISLFITSEQTGRPTQRMPGALFSRVGWSPNEVTKHLHWWEVLECVEV